MPQCARGLGARLRRGLPAPGDRLPALAELVDGTKEVRLIHVPSISSFPGVTAGDEIGAALRVLGEPHDRVRHAFDVADFDELDLAAVEEAADAARARRHRRD